jgi:flavin reductase (DIM6/NTAB) family NADH-FMN oxidoreductase RutF
MRLDPAGLDRRTNYGLMIACLVPRPIAWVSTLAEDGTPNLAPFSFNGGVTTDPPTLMLSVGRRRDGSRKDTAENILATREAVVHIPTRPLGAAMVVTAADEGPGHDEFEAAGLARVASELVAPARIAEAPVAMETRLVHHQPVGRAPVDLFLLEVVLYHLDDRILAGGLPDPERFDPIGRLGGSLYCGVTPPFAL